MTKKCCFTRNNKNGFRKSEGKHSWRKRGWRRRLSVLLQKFPVTMSINLTRPRKNSDKISIILSLMIPSLSSREKQLVWLLYRSSLNCLKSLMMLLRRRMRSLESLILSPAILNRILKENRCSKVRKIQFNIRSENPRKRVSLMI